MDFDEIWAEVERYAAEKGVEGPREDLKDIVRGGLEANPQLFPHFRRAALARVDELAADRSDRTEPGGSGDVSAVD